MSKKFVVIGFILVLVMGLVSCKPTVTETPVVETEAPVETVIPPTPTPSLEELATAEGTIVSYGLPDSWVNYAGMWEIYTNLYGIPHQDTDMSSGEILAALEAEKSSPVADITDLGLNFAKIVEDNAYSMPYKNSKWDEIPDYAKDPDGRWSAAYWGAIAFTVNPAVVTNVPQTWDDLLKDEYIGKVCMKDPRSSATANMVVLAAAYARGGDETNVQPGLDFFQQMIEKKILNGVKPSNSAIQKGECPISLFWDFDGLSNAKSLPELGLQVVIPSDGTVAGLYIQFVTAGAPHPNAAKLMIETEYSDEGQLAYANGFVHPIRASVTLPAELLAKFPPAEAYAAVNFPKDYVALDLAAAAISDGWTLIAE